MKNLVSYTLKEYIISNLKITLCEETDPLKKYYERYGEKWIETHDLDDILKEIEDQDNYSNLKSIETWLVDDEYYIIKFYGGLNGPGKWIDYLKDIQLIVNRLEDSYLIDLDIDVPDDVWTLYVGMRKNKN